MPQLAEEAVVVLASTAPLLQLSECCVLSFSVRDRTWSQPGVLTVVTVVRTWDHTSSLLLSVSQCGQTSLPSPHYKHRELRPGQTQRN